MRFENISYIRPSLNVIKIKNMKFTPNIIIYHRFNYSIHLQYTYYKYIYISSQKMYIDLLLLGVFDQQSLWKGNMPKL